MMSLAITDHCEGPRGQSSAAVFEQVARQTELADRLGFEFAWFAEHHGHVHQGHLPAPLLFALHLAGRTERIHLGPAVICLNLHSPLAVAEQCATADILMGGRGAFGFGSGSSPPEAALFGLSSDDTDQRHVRCEAALRLILAAWGGRIDAQTGTPFALPPQEPLPAATPGLASRSWLAVNSDGAARVAGLLGFNMLFSHLRTPAQYRQYRASYRSAGGSGRVAANRPVHVARDDGTAMERAGPALKLLWRRFRSEGKIPQSTPEPTCLQDLCAHPINFLVGGPATVARKLAELNEEAPFDVANLEVRWDGLGEADIHDCMRRLGDVIP